MGRNEYMFSNFRISLRLSIVTGDKSILANSPITLFISLPPQLSMPTTRISSPAQAQSVAALSPHNLAHHIIPYNLNRFILLIEIPKGTNVQKNQKLS